MRMVARGAAGYTIVSLLTIAPFGRELVCTLRLFFGVAMFGAPGAFSRTVRARLPPASSFACHVRRSCPASLPPPRIPPLPWPHHSTPGEKAGSQ